MSEGPWSRPPPPKDGHGPEEPPRAPPPGRWRFPIWSALALGIFLLVMLLYRLFPGAIRTTDDWASVGYSALLLAVVASGLSRLRRDHWPKYLRYGGVWLGIVAVLALAAAYQDELKSIPQRVQMAFLPGTAVATSQREVVVAQNDEGSYVIMGKVNGQPVRFIVDTGATETVLAPADARRLGIDVDGLNYEHLSETANGTGRSAAHVTERLEVGPIAFDSFPVAVNQADMSASLLGLTFLDRLESYEFRGRKLILRWRGPADGPSPAR